jgi:hypothetical protein
MKRHVLLVALVLIAATASAAMAKSKSASKSATKSVTTSEPRAVSKSEPRSDFGLKGLGVAVGFVSPENLDGTFSIGAFANLGMITPNIGLEPRLDYWGWSKSEFSVDAKVHDVALGARQVLLRHQELADPAVCGRRPRASLRRRAGRDSAPGGLPGHDGE